MTHTFEGWSLLSNRPILDRMPQTSLAAERQYLFNPDQRRLIKVANTIVSHVVGFSNDDRDNNQERYHDNRISSCRDCYDAIPSEEDCMIYQFFLVASNN